MTSTAQGGDGPYTCIRCLDATWNDDDICDACAAPEPARKTLRMLVDRDWLREKIAADPDDHECEALNPARATLSQEQKP